MASATATLTTSDGVELVVERRLAERSSVVRGFLEDFGVNPDDTIDIPLSEVSSQVMLKVLEWCRNHEHDAEADFGDEEMTLIDNNMLIDLIKAANYLEIEALLAHATSVAAKRIRGRSPEVVKSLFDIEDDETPQNLDFGCSVDLETVTLLPYTSTFHATPAGAFHVYHLLLDRLAPELVTPIVSSGYTPWLVKRRVDEQTYHANDFRIYSVAGLYLSTAPIPYPETGQSGVIPKRIVFQTSAADQGWVTFGGEGTFNNSHTWFEASILQPLVEESQNADQFSALEDDQDLSQTFKDVASAREALKAKGWDFVRTTDGQITWKVCNNITAVREYRTYRNEWRRGIDTVVEDERALGRGEGFLELLKSGRIVVLWARAEQGAWAHHVQAATIEIEFELEGPRSRC